LLRPPVGVILAMALFMRSRKARRVEPAVGMLQDAA
jgi:hypothetical protein